MPKKIEANTRHADDLMRSSSEKIKTFFTVR